MMLDGQTPLIILIVMALAIVAIGVYIRFFMMRGPSDEDVVLSRSLQIGRSAGSGEEAGAETPGAPEDSAAGGLSGIDLPPSSRDSPPAGLAPDGLAAVTVAGPGQPDKKGLLSGIGGGLVGLMGTLKSKDQIKGEVKIIDSQLAQVLQQSEEISVPESLPHGLTDSIQPGLPDGISLSLPDSMSLSPPDGMPLSLPDEIPLSPPESIQASVPDAMPDAGLAIGSVDGIPAQESPSSMAVQKLCKEYVMPDAPVLSGSDGLGLGTLGPGVDGKEILKKPEDAKDKQKGKQTREQVGDFTGKAPDESDNLLKDLEEEAAQEQEIDMSIMKDYRDMPITCTELEADLKSILYQMTSSANGNKNSRM